jgi:cytochrome b involved in lipid metabolism
MKPQTKALIVVICVVVIGIGAYIISSDSQTATNIEPGTTSALPESQITTTPISLGEVAQHNKKDDCWTIISGNVYNITAYVPRHPGGDTILEACGTDSTILFTSRTSEDGEKIGSGTPHSSNAASQLQNYLLGPVEQ